MDSKSKPTRSLIVSCIRTKDIPPLPLTCIKWPREARIWRETNDGNTLDDLGGSSEVR